MSCLVGDHSWGTDFNPVDGLHGQKSQPAVKFIETNDIV
jgi:hypothetical protein